MGGLSGSARSFYLETHLVSNPTITLTALLHDVEIKLGYAV
jgi:hypothetical protein